MHCGCSVHLDGSACVLLLRFVGVGCSGVGRFAHATHRRRLALARLDRQQVVVGALLVREGRAAGCVLGPPDSGACGGTDFFWPAGNAESMDCRTGQRMAISASGLPETRGS